MKGGISDVLSQPSKRHELSRVRPRQNLPTHVPSWVNTDFKMQSKNWGVKISLSKQTLN
jgi:hypothetical protein